MKENKKIYIGCRCGGDDHLLIFSMYYNFETNKEEDCYVSFVHRPMTLLGKIKWLFSNESSGELTLCKENTPKLKEVVDFLEQMEY